MASQLGRGTVYFDDKRKLWTADFRWKAEGVSERKIFRNKKKTIVVSEMNDFRHRLELRQKLDIQNGTCFGEYANYWLTEIIKNSVKPTSFMRKEQVVKYQVLPYIGDCDMTELTSADIQTLLNNLNASYSYSTTKKAYEAINGCFKHFCKTTHWDHNPCDGVIVPTTKKKQVSDIRFLSTKQIVDFENEATRSYGNGTPVYKWGYLFVVLLYTGMRVGEMLALEWNDVDFDRKTVTVTKDAVEVPNEQKGSGRVILIQDTPKTDSSNRVIPLNSKSEYAFLQLRKLTGNEKYVCASSNHNVLRLYNLNKTYHRILQSCGIEKTANSGFGIHSLRHTFATMLFRNGCQTKLVSKLLGHSDTAITEKIYIHIIQEQEAKAINDLDSYLD